jgi:hypothetical protein
MNFQIYLLFVFIMNVQINYKWKIMHEQEVMLIKSTYIFFCYNWWKLTLDPKCITNIFEPNIEALNNFGWYSSVFFNFPSLVVWKRREVAEWLINYSSYWSDRQVICDQSPELFMSNGSDHNLLNKVEIWIVVCLTHPQYFIQLHNLYQ